MRIMTKKWWQVKKGYMQGDDKKRLKILSTIMSKFGVEKGRKGVVII